MRLLSLFSPTRSFLLGSCALLLLPGSALAQYDAWRGHFSLGAGPALPRFAYRRDVSVSLQLPRRTLPTVALGATRQLTEHFAVGVEQRMTGIDYALRYRHRNGGTSTVQLAEGILVQNGVNAQLLLPLGLDWELGLVTNASLTLASFGVYGGPTYVWQRGSGDGQDLKMSVSQIRQTTLFTGAELRLLHWLGGSPHGLQLTAGYQQGLYNLVRADSQEFEYNGADSQLYRGAFGLRLKGSYASVQLGYCYAFGQGQTAAAPKRRWSSPRYSQPAPPPADENEPVEAESEE